MAGEELEKKREERLKDITNDSSNVASGHYSSDTRQAMAEVRTVNQRLRTSLQAMRSGIGLLQGQIAERKRVLEEQAAFAAAAHPSSDAKLAKTEDSVQDSRSSLFLN